MIYGKAKHLFKYYGLNDNLDELLDYLVSGQSFTTSEFILNKHVKGKKTILESELKDYYRAKKKHILLIISLNDLEVKVNYTKDLQKVLERVEQDNYFYELKEEKLNAKLEENDFVILFPEDASNLKTKNELIIFEIELI